ncbi:hemerythrin family protein [Pseudodesulfovibrio sp.]|uniref:bacteriohemerythrin n=1 Tax=Pseudodesulfovibrio sp. TaxID=2035812 RepID=UPI00260764F9|nr:hemerythrin family protein [Pseudodesulfovibrio sp.]MDD3313736.1 hemerythrin family protein [Pseudodesulfovibrio sp.]
MTQVDWTVTLDTGLPRIDEQHRRLIGYSNDLLRAIAEGHGEASLQAFFEKLLDYTNSHFADEEEYMESVGYPDLEAHRAVHRRLINDVANSREKILGGVPVDPKRALEFINGWIVRHIMVMDSRIGEFVRIRARG